MRSQPIPGADPKRLESHVRELCEGFFPRDAFHPEILGRAAGYICSRLEEAGAGIADQAFAIEGRTYRNVVAFFGPPTRERVVVGAHYDVCGELPGADDNASGVAGLLELARLLSTAPLSTRVELVAFTLEEPPAFGSPAMGSAVHAKSLRGTGAGVRAMLSLEMIGCFLDEPATQRYPLPLLRLFYPGRGNFLALAGRFSEIRLLRRVKASMRRASALPIRWIAAPRGLFGIDLSDNVSYWDQGYPAIMVTDTAFFRNERYHTEADTPDTLDYKRMAEVITGLRGAILDLAG